MSLEKLYPYILSQINIGIFVVNRDLEVIFWNRFMAVNSGVKPEEVVGRPLFERFPELPQQWFERQCRSVFLLKQFAFSRWEQRPYLFKFKNTQPVTADVPTMRQDCTFMPVKDDDGRIEAVGVIITDATETSVYQTGLNAAMAKLEEISIRDGLTGVFNRRHIESLAEIEFGRNKRYRSPLSIAMLDLDHFKQVNDLHGHSAGDAALREVVKCLTRRIRVTDCLGRFGGEEFLILLPGINGVQAVQAAEHFRRAIENLSITTESGLIQITISIGTCEATPHHDTLRSLINDADAALYQAKRNGRNRVIACTFERGDNGAEGQLKFLTAEDTTR